MKPYTLNQNRDEDYMLNDPIPSGKCIERDIKFIALGILVFLLPSTIGCREKYEMTFPSAQTSFLVVEGVINTHGSTKINLSRTTLLSESGINYENNAVVEIQGEDNSRYPLSYTDSGRYISPNVFLNEETRYRLSIQTVDNRQYLSSYVQAVKTPEIDSITWTRPDDGIEIFVNAKDDVNNTQYYKFDYQETWEFKSVAKSNAVTLLLRNPPLLGDVLVAPIEWNRWGYDTSIYICWQSRSPTNILIANTLKLKNNQLYFPIVQYPQGAWPFSVLYSINVQQQGLSKEGYTFFQRMQKNSESLGSIFDAQPSEIPGNVFCISDTSEKVVGFVDASRTKTKRLFIKNSDLKNWNYNDPCRVYLIKGLPQSMYDTLWMLKYKPISASDPVPVSTAPCVDCTLRGPNIRPSFWPN